MNFSLRKLWRGVTITAVVFTLATSQLLFGAAVTYAADTPAPATTLPTTSRAEDAEDALNKAAWTKCVKQILDEAYQARLTNKSTTVYVSPEAYPTYVLQEGKNETQYALSSYSHRIVMKKGGKNCDAARAYKWHMKNKGLFGHNDEGSYDGLRTTIFSQYMTYSSIPLTKIVGDAIPQPPLPSGEKYGQPPNPAARYSSQNVGGTCSDGSCSRKVDEDGAATYRVPDGQPASAGDTTGPNGEIPSPSTEGGNGGGGATATPTQETQEDVVDRSCGTSTKILSWVFSEPMIRYISCQIMYAVRNALSDIMENWFEISGTTDVLYTEPVN